VVLKGIHKEKGSASIKLTEPFSLCLRRIHVIELELCVCKVLDSLSKRIVIVYRGQDEIRTYNIVMFAFAL